jgi:8-oxo-dGTP pyrophosphatase MutT (NUDIX family)
MSLADKLRSALERPPTAPPIAGDLPEQRAEAHIAAAVLVAITERSQPGLLLTVRNEGLRAHAGQIAFAGGRLDLGEDAATGALREAQEELGLDPVSVRLVGAIDEYRTVTGYAITPIVGVVAPDLPITPHEPEVADWFEAPLAFLLDPANQLRRSALLHGSERHYYEIPWQGRRIWGATAAIIVNLSRRLQWN